MTPSDAAEDISIVKRKIDNQDEIDDDENDNDAETLDWEFRRNKR